jgi:hypothetical protein
MNIEGVEAAKKMGPYHFHRQQSLVDWSDRNSAIIGYAALQALEIPKDRSKIGAYLIAVVYVDFPNYFSR